MFRLQVILFPYIWQSSFTLNAMKLELGKLYISFPIALKLTGPKKLVLRRQNLCLAFTISSIGGLAKQHNIVYFRSPINSKSQDHKQFKSGTSHITHHTRHLHITYEFEVLQNIMDKNDCFCNKKISKVEQNSLFFKRKEKEKAIIWQKKHQVKCFFLHLFVFFI